MDTFKIHCLIGNVAPRELKGGFIVHCFSFSWFFTTTIKTTTQFITFWTYSCRLIIVKRDQIIQSFALIRLDWQELLFLRVDTTIKDHS